MPAPRGETFLQKVSKELSAAASRRQSKGKSFEGVDASSLLAPRKHENGHVISSSARVRLSPAVGQREVELNSSRPEQTPKRKDKDTSRRATPKSANGVATRNALTVEREGVRARHGHQKKRASTATDVDVAFEEASRTNLGKNQRSHVCLLQVRDADLLEAWSRGETLVVEDDDEVEHFQEQGCDAENDGSDVIEIRRNGSLLWQDSPRKMRRRVRKLQRLRHLKEPLINGNGFQQAHSLQNGETWVDPAIDVEKAGKAWEQQALDELEANVEEVCEEPEEEPEDVEELENVEHLEDAEEEVEYFPDELVEEVEEGEEGEEGEEEEEDMDDMDAYMEVAEDARELAEPSKDSPGNGQASKRHQASLVPAVDIDQDPEPPRKRAKLVPEKSQTAPKVVRLRSRPQLVPAPATQATSKKAALPKQAHYMPPHEKRRHMELAKWKETKAAWHRKLQEEEAQGTRPKQKGGPNIRALARRFEATLEKPGSCCLNPLQKDEGIEVCKDGLRAACEPASNAGPVRASGIKGLPLVAGGRYQFEVELRRGGSVTIGWSAALVLPSVLEGRSAARRMLGFSSDGELIGGEGPMRPVPAFGRPGDIVGALLDWPEDACGPRLAFMLNGKFLGIAFDFLREGISAPPLQPHICQGNGKPFSILLRGATNQVPLRFPMAGFRPLGSVLERHFSPFSKAVELATAADEPILDRQLKQPPAAARRLIHSSLGLALPLPHLAQERVCCTAAGKKVRVVTRQDDPED